MALSRNTKIGIWLTATIFFITFSFYGYQIFFTKNWLIGKSEGKWLYIPKNSSYEAVLDSIRKDTLLNDELSFQFLTRALNYRTDVKSGAYFIKPNASNLDVLRALKSGRQTPIKLTFNNIRLKSELIQKLSDKLEMQTADLQAILNNPDSTASYGFDTTTIVAMFIPNTYEVYWDISANQLVKKMQKEYKRFWTDERLAKAKAMNFTPIQVSILASIAEAETKKADEMPIVAGVYKNRLDQNMPLQADPTVVFAVGDFTIKRVREGHKASTSPYNTYKYNGLPPGPINLPSVTALNAALNYQHHDYLFFCAREDFSGYHNFSADYNQHLKNARTYQHALDSANIQ
ncbi:UPF0755 protein [Flexibacter flexilis DSM 6793]|uniref:Endolytic murein transglycosylase n=1 Tax=Flexibacter flexilis DSM 6793 TaxID=927664 RepID=A0A1I1MSK6_9BACT|nr:endolytic transglycosylase MltG [Flexibacter flexilis]SFC88359.1 UPF0755 protein [Flexibacter flexilis DSM 6793]